MSKKFVAYFKENYESKKIKLGEFNDKEDAIKACIDRANGDYCLDNKEKRIEALRERNFCICGCGPSEISIDEKDC